jgi:hypothetical protein
VSISYVSSRYLLIGANSTLTHPWVWSTLDGLTWRHVTSMKNSTGFRPDAIERVWRLDPGWIAIGERSLGSADDSHLVAWRSSDLVTWTRLAPPTSACGGTAHTINQAALIRGKVVTVGNSWALDTGCAETVIGAVTP